jgi:hypothetical protein
MVAWTILCHTRSDFPVLGFSSPLRILPPAVSATGFGIFMLHRLSVFKVTQASRVSLSGIVVL